MLDLGPWPGLPGFKLLQSVPHFPRFRDRQHIVGIDVLLRRHGDTAVLCRYFHEAPLFQGERVEDLRNDNLPALADAARGAGSCFPFSLDGFGKAWDSSAVIMGGGEAL